jgi:hypothetical protein
VLDVSDLDDTPGALGSGEDAAGLLEGHTERLLHEEVEAALEERDGHFGMEGGGHNHASRVAMLGELVEVYEPPAAEATADLGCARIIRLEDAS